MNQKHLVDEPKHRRADLVILEGLADDVVRALHRHPGQSPGRLGTLQAGEGLAE
jgi:hypothetical protein